MTWAPSSAPRQPVTEQAAEMDAVWNIFLYLAIAIAVIVAGLIVFAVLRFRRRSDDLTDSRDEHVRIELTYTAIPLVIVAALFAITVVSLDSVEADDADPDVVVDVTAFQWQWRFDYDEHDISIVGGPDEYPELVLPADADVQFDLTSTDVVHSFWIPGFRYKRDIFPEETTSFQVHIDDVTGTWDSVGTCAEFCGLDHARMRFTLRIVTAEEFEVWLGEQEGAR